MKTVGVIGRDEDEEGHRDRGAVRRRRRRSCRRRTRRPPPSTRFSSQSRRAARSCSARTRRPRAASPARPRSCTRPARAAGLPDGAIGWMTTVTLEGTQELMKPREVAVILATGGMGLVRAAYSAGKPAYGVGPGQRAVLHRASRPTWPRPPRDIVIGKASTTACSARRPTRWSSTEAIDRGAAARSSGASGGHFLSRRRGRRAGQGARHAAAAAESRRWSASRPPSSPRKLGIKVPDGTRALIAELKGVGRDYPLSIEKLCPVLSYYVVKDWREGCERCKQILRYGGMGHTMSIHSRNEQVILEFGLHKPAFRICVNTPTTLGSIGLTTGLDPGDDAGLRRLRRQHHVGQHLAAAPAEHQAGGLRHPGGRRARGAAAAGRPPVRRAVR